MSEANRLREAIHDELVIFANNAMNADVKYITEARNRSRDAILDAVIANLPKAITPGKVNTKMDAGRVDYSYDVYNLLTSAKRGTPK